MWWLTVVGKPVWVPSVRDMQFMPWHRKEAFRLFMAGKTRLLLRGQ